MNSFLKCINEIHSMSPVIHNSNPVKPCPCQTLDQPAIGKRDKKKELTRFFDAIICAYSLTTMEALSAIGIHCVHLKRRICVHNFIIIFDRINHDVSLDNFSWTKLFALCRARSWSLFIVNIYSSWKINGISGIRRMWWLPSRGNLYLYLCCIEW